MRRLLLLALSLLAVSALAQDHWLESSVTVAITLSATGDQLSIPGRNETVTEIAAMETLRLGNKEILQALVDEGRISSIKGWKLVAVWANWADADPVAGPSYRFYAKGRFGNLIDSVKIPSSIFSYSASTGAYSYRVTKSADTITGGKETYRELSEIFFGTPATDGSLRGLRVGTGRYARIKSQGVVRFVPGSSKLTGAGEFSEDGETVAGVVGGSVSFGAAKLKLSEGYVLPTGGSPGPTIPINVDVGGAVSVN